MHQPPNPAPLTPSPKPNRAIARDKLAWLLVAQALAILPILINMPIWLWCVWALSAFWRIQMYRGVYGIPGGLVKGVVAMACAAGLFASYSAQTGTDTMVGLLACAFSLKLLEVNSRRDAQLLVLIGFIICATQLLFNQSPLAACYALACLWVLLIGWRSLYREHQENTGQQIKRAGTLLLHSLPIMLVLFVVIPRLGPLWATPSQQAAKTGFSDSLAPGDLGKLVQSKEPAFRVEFADAAPSAATLYWRGLIMDRFDGRRWHLREDWAIRSAIPQAPSVTGEALDYSIIAEPHGQHWLFALMTPVTATAVSNPVRLGNDGLLMARYPLAQRLRYQVRSIINPGANQAPELSNPRRQGNLRLPAGFNPQTHELAQRWREQGLTDEQLIAQALQLFNRDFTYTLEPPVLGQHSVDEFLFTSKRGFCEHFASSFTVLMRAAGVPARVVVGYQGGRWNDVENYLLVSQSDAHAWVEVWLEGQGWIRLDPTSAVAPDRIEHGAGHLADNRDYWGDSGLGAMRYGNYQIFQQLRSMADYVNYRWTRDVLGYDSASQDGLMQRLLGDTSLLRRLGVMLAIMAVLTGLILFWALRGERREQHPLDRLYRRYCQRLANEGVIREAGEGPQAFARRVARELPKRAAEAEEFARLYMALRYRPAGSRDKLLEQRLRRLAGRGLPGFF